MLGDVVTSVLGVEVSKPADLTLGGTLARHLEIQPRIDDGILLDGLSTEPVRGVVLVNEVLHARGRLPDDKVVVSIFTMSTSKRKR